MLTRAVFAVGRRTISVGLREWVERQLGLVLIVELVAGLLVSVGAAVAFVEIAEEVAEGDTRRFDEAVLLWINALSPGWLDKPMHAVTALGYYKVVVPLLLLSALAFYLKGRSISAALLIVSTTGGIVLTTVLKAVFERARPDLFDSGYSASFYSFPSGHATVAVGFYGTLALLLAWRLTGPSRWTVVAVGAVLVLLIGFSRLYLGVHYPRDVIAGFLAAPLWVGAIEGAYFLYLLLRGSRRKASAIGDSSPPRSQRLVR